MENRIVIRDDFNKRLLEIAKGDNENYKPIFLGMPSNILLSCGFPNLKIEMAVQRLVDKKVQQNHPFSFSAILDMPEYIANPIAVFQSKTKMNSKVILTEMTQDNINMVVAIETNTPHGVLFINSVRSLYQKDNIREILLWICEDNLMEYVDKNKVVDWLSKQQSHSADVTKLINHTTNIVQSFENPQISDKNKSTDNQQHKKFAIGGSINRTKNMKNNPPKGVFYAKIKPIREGAPELTVRVSTDEVGDFIAGYQVYSPPNSTKKVAYFPKETFLLMLEQDEYTIIPKEEVKFEEGGEIKKYELKKSHGKTYLIYNDYEHTYYYDRPFWYENGIGKVAPSIQKNLENIYNELLEKYPKEEVKFEEGGEIIYASGGKVDMGQLEIDMQQLKNKYPNAKISYTFAKDSSEKGYVLTAKENGKIIYSSYKMAKGGDIKAMAEGRVKAVLDKEWTFEDGKDTYRNRIKKGIYVDKEQDEKGYNLIELDKNGRKIYQPVSGIVYNYFDKEKHAPKEIEKLPIPKVTKEDVDSFYELGRKAKFTKQDFEEWGNPNTWTNDNVQDYMDTEVGYYFGDVRRLSDEDYELWLTELKNEAGKEYETRLKNMDNKMEHGGNINNDFVSSFDSTKKKMEDKPQQERIDALIESVQQHKWSSKPINADSGIVKTYSKMYDLEPIRVASIFNKYQKKYAEGGTVDKSDFETEFSNFKKYFPKYFIDMGHKHSADEEARGIEFLNQIHKEAETNPDAMNTMHQWLKNGNTLVLRDDILKKYTDYRKDAFTSNDPSALLDFNAFSSLDSAGLHYRESHKMERGGTVTSVLSEINDDIHGVHAMPSDHGVNAIQVTSKYFNTLLDIKQKYLTKDAILQKNSKGDYVLYGSINKGYFENGGDITTKKEFKFNKHSDVIAYFDGKEEKDFFKKGEGIIGEVIDENENLYNIKSNNGGSYFVDKKDGTLCDFNDAKKMERGGIIYSGTMNTPDGEIKGIVRENWLDGKFDVVIDGSQYGQHKKVEDALEELEASGFKNVKKFAHGGGVWTNEQQEKVNKLDNEFEEAVKEKGIERNSKDAADLWRSGGFQKRMGDIFGKKFSTGGLIDGEPERETIDGFKVTRYDNNPSEGKTLIRIQGNNGSDTNIMGIVYPSIKYPEKVTNLEAVKEFKKIKFAEGGDIPSEEKTTNLIPTPMYTTVKQCLLADGDNENDFIAEGSVIFTTDANKEKWTIKEFYKLNGVNGAVLCHEPNSSLSTKQDDKHIPLSGLRSEFETGKIEVGGIEAGNTRIFNICLKSVSKCIDMINLEYEKQEVENNLAETEEHLNLYHAKEQAELDAIQAEKDEEERIGEELRKDEIFSRLQEKAREIRTKKQAQEALELAEGFTAEQITDTIAGAELVLADMEEGEEKEALQDYIAGLKVLAEEKTGSEVYADGGFVGKGELVWRKLDSAKKSNFLRENFTPEITPRSQETLVGTAFNFLPKKVKIKLESKYANVEEYAKGGGVGELNKKFNIGDVVWDIEHEDYGVVLDNYGDPIQGSGGEIRLDSDGNVNIFTYDKEYKNTGYNLIHKGEKGDKGDGNIEHIKKSAERILEISKNGNGARPYADYKNIYSRLLKGEFDKKLAKGGDVKGMTREEIWKSMSVEKRREFLEEHKAFINKEHKKDSKNTTLNLYDWATYTYMELPQAIKQSLFLYDYGQHGGKDLSKTKHAYKKGDKVVLYAERNSEKPDVYIVEKYIKFDIGVKQHYYALKNKTTGELGFERWESAIVPFKSKKKSKQKSLKAVAA